MQSIDLSGLERLDDELKTFIDELPEMQRKLHEDIADIIKDEIDAQITESGLNDSQGRIKDWQVARVGSRGGYAAISASKGAVGNNSPGAITNYLENGHRIRGPSGKSKRYRPRIFKPYVDGFHFYKVTRVTVEARVISAVESFLENAKKKLEG